MASGDTICWIYSPLRRTHDNMLELINKNNSTDYKLSDVLFVERSPIGQKWEVIYNGK